MAWITTTLAITISFILLPAAAGASATDHGEPLLGKRKDERGSAHMVLFPRAPFGLGLRSDGAEAPTCAGVPGRAHEENPDYRCADRQHDDACTRDPETG